MYIVEKQVFSLRVLRQKFSTVKVKKIWIRVSQRVWHQYLHFQRHCRWRNQDGLDQCFFFLLIKVFFKVKKKWNDEKRCFSIWNNRFSSFYVYRWHFELRFLEMYFTLFQHHELMPDIWKYYNSMILYYVKQTVENMWHSKMSDAMIL
jgi:hypothetical protein